MGIFDALSAPCRFAAGHDAPFAACMLIGIVILILGLTRKIFAENPLIKSLRRRNPPGKSMIGPVIGLCARITSFPPLNLARSAIIKGLPFKPGLSAYREGIAGAATLAVLFAGLLLALLLRHTGQLWYVKLVLLILCFLLPFYIATLGFDLYRHRIDRQVPHLVDEFRSAFIRTGRIKNALNECSGRLGKGLSDMIRHAADSPHIDSGLMRLREEFGNIWLGMFVILLLNYKENGGELVSRLYELSRTMTRYAAVERKKDRRLIWYELFAVMSSVFSIPAVIWLNCAILGSDAAELVDTRSNMLISRIICFSILSLVFVRLLRKF